MTNKDKKYMQGKANKTLHLIGKIEKEDYN